MATKLHASPTSGSRVYCVTIRSAYLRPRQPLEALLDGWHRSSTTSRAHRRSQICMRLGWSSMRLDPIESSGERVLKEHSCRFSLTNDHSLISEVWLCLIWCYLASGPCGHRTGRFLVSRMTSGRWRKGVGIETRAFGLTSQTPCLSLRPLLPVGPPQLPKQSRVLDSTVQPSKSLQ